MKLINSKGDVKMRLSKRQLKRIIREEYSRLKRRGLIKENVDLSDAKDEFCITVERFMASAKQSRYCLSTIAYSFEEFLETEENDYDAMGAVNSMWAQSGQDCYVFADMLCDLIMQDGGDEKTCAWYLRHPVGLFRKDGRY